MSTDAIEALLKHMNKDYVKASELPKREIRRLEKMSAIKQTKQSLH